MARQRNRLFIQAVWKVRHLLLGFIDKYTAKSGVSAMLRATNLCAHQRSHFVCQRFTNKERSTRAFFQKNGTNLQLNPDKLSILRTKH